ncbi:MAG: hypothetical protein IKM40_03000 [Clostridia bacterium]|nr:hypothetical protein [Clostridia bacterium]MBR3845526.1 hypothetical protein [Clostridia bacterium]
MDFTFVEKIENDGVCYKLLRSNFYKGYYLIIAQDKRDFYSGSVFGAKEDIHSLFCEIAESSTPPFALRDILYDFDKQSIR